MPGAIGRTSKSVMDTFRLGGKGGRAAAGGINDYLQGLDPYTIAKMTGLPQTGAALAKAFNSPGPYQIIGDTTMQAASAVVPPYNPFPKPTTQPNVSTKSTSPTPTPQHLAAPTATSTPSAKPLEPGSLGAMPGSSGIQSNKPSKEATPFTEGYAGPYDAPTGQEAAIQMEQKKQGNLDALIVALGDIGSSLMGPFQNSWQAELGKTASNMARSRVYASAMESALAGEVPDDMALGLLTPEQQVQISQTVSQQQMRKLQEREVATGETRAETEKTRAKTEETQGARKLTIEEARDTRNIEEFTKTWPTQKAEIEARTDQYKAYARNIDAKVGATDVSQTAKDEAFAKADKYMSNIKDLSPEAYAAEWQRVYTIFLNDTIDKLGATTPTTKDPKDYLKTIKGKDY